LENKNVYEACLGKDASFITFVDEREAVEQLQAADFEFYLKTLKQELSTILGLAFLEFYNHLCHNLKLRSFLEHFLSNV